MDITQIIIILIGLCATAVTSFVIPWLKEKINNEKFKNVVSTIGRYVRGAEQLLGSKTGAAKKELVIAWLVKKGITVDSNIDAIIESAVYSLNKIINEVNTSVK